MSQGTFVIRIDAAGDPNEIPPNTGALIFTFNFNFNFSETGTVKTTETVETPVGTFEDCFENRISNRNGHDT